MALHRELGSLQMQVLDFIAKNPDQHKQSIQKGISSKDYGSVLNAVNALEKSGFIESIKEPSEKNVPIKLYNCTEKGFQFVWLLPGYPVMALMIGAMIIHNIQPGPQVLTRNPALFWGLVASMWIGNLMLLILNLPLISIWIKLLEVPYRYLFPAIVLFCAIGAYSMNNSTFDIWMLAGFGFVAMSSSNSVASPPPWCWALSWAP
jgi:hypothetical protein